MAQDRIVTWQDKKVSWHESKPTKSEIRRVALNFLGGIGKVSRWKDCWLSVLIPGSVTHPLKDLKGVPTSCNLTAKNTNTSNMKYIPEERWFEVFWQEDHVSVITRPLADEFTGCIADQFARILARWWEAKLEMPG